MKGYDPQKIEEKWRKFWEKEKIYKFSFKKGEIYSVDTPPPTLSGKMHVGHAFSYSQEDFIVRFRRMLLAGKGQVFYPFGTDDNGLPTERLVEKIKKIDSKKMSRTKFIDLCLKTLKEITPDFIQDWKNLGISCDYDVYYSTINKKSQKLSQKSFIDLFKKGHIYKKEFPTIWCSECQTSIAQAELEDKEFESFFSTLKFKVSMNNNEENLLIATTRPELLPACVAVFVHPEDKKYRKFVGKKAKVPLFDFEVPVIADKTANLEKGTGAMMICSYGDKTDVDAIQKHKLNPKIIINKDGTMNLEKYKQMSVKEARKKILKELKDNGFISSQEKIIHAVNVHDKCGTEIEFLPAEQWFVKVLDKKKELINQGKKINWYPKFMFKRYENWVNGLEWDWNISRNRHFGISIPVWVCGKCKEIILPEEKELPLDPIQIKKKCKKCNTEAIPEKKVLDTWATSSLSPVITSSLIDNKIKIPYSLRPQAHDIIRTWAFYTIVKSYLHENKIPWKDIVISGFVRLEGEKMSKSKGNVIEPQEIMNKYGADALRFWASGSKLGEDLNYREEDLIAGKRFVIKLINASRFIFMNLKNFEKKPKKLELIDELFLNDLEILEEKVTGYFKNYEYSKAKIEIEEFFWKKFCDNYLEIVKKRIYNGKKQEKESAQYALYESLLVILKMIAPVTPFITEEIYQTYYRKKEKDKSIHISKWPKYVKGKKQSKELKVFYEILSKIRQEKTKAKKSMNAKIILTLEKKDYKILNEMLDDLKNVTNAQEIEQGKFNVRFI